MMNERDRFGWARLRYLANLRVVRTSYIWILFVPAAAKLLLPFAGIHEIKLPWSDGTTRAAISIDVGLPFSWVAFVWMSICFFLGYVVYLAACPEIAKTYNNFGEYRTHHPKGTFRLNGFLAVAFANFSNERLVQFVSKLQYGEDTENLLRELGQSRHVDGALRERALEACSLPYTGISETRVNEVFDQLLDFERGAFRVWFWISAVLSAMGILLFIFVLCENFRAFLTITGVLGAANIAPVS